jgi:hypothetical protein
MKSFAMFCPGPKEGKVINGHEEAMLRPYHLVCENSIQSIMLKGDHPIQTLELVWPHRAIDD